MKYIVCWFTVRDLNEINDILLDYSEEKKEDYGLSGFDSAEQIISITPDISDNRNYLVFWRYLTEKEGSR